MPRETGRMTGSASWSPSHPIPTRAALVDLTVLVVFVWASAILIHFLDLAGGLAEWNRTYQEWAIDEVTMVSLCLVAALGVFSWRRWQESQRTIACNQETLNRLRSIEDVVSDKDRLIHAVSHELRTPITAMLGYAALLSESEIGHSDREEMVETILTQGRDLADIVEDLLTRAQAEAHTLRLAGVPVQLAAQARQVLEGWNHADLPGVQVTGCDTTQGIGDPARVRQILRNLITNARRYGEAPFTVNVTRRSDAVALTVSDHGQGVPPAEEGRIFDPYHRVDGTGAAPGGLGLGLSISRHLAVMTGDVVPGWMV